MDTVIQVQILDKAVCISYSANTLSSLRPTAIVSVRVPSMGQIELFDLLLGIIICIEYQCLRSFNYVQTNDLFKIELILNINT